MEILRAIGCDVGSAGDDVKGSIRRSLLAATVPERPREARRHRPFARRPLAILAAVLVVPSAVAIGAGVNGDVAGRLHGFISGSDQGQSIGRAVEPADDPPEWWDDFGFTERRVLATTGEHHLFAARDEDGHVAFALDDGISLTSASAFGAGENAAEPDPFSHQFQGQSVVPLVVGLADRSREPLIAGLVADDVASVELRFDSGSPDVQAVDGPGFIFAPDLGRTESEDGKLLADRRPTEIAVFDADGNELQSVSAACIVGMPATVLRATSERDFPVDVVPCPEEIG